MKLSQVYLNAAKAVFDSGLHRPWDSSFSHTVACHGIYLQTGFFHTPAHKAFATAFKPRGRSIHEPWFGGTYTDYHTEAGKIRALEGHNKKLNHRVFALLFMRELAKDAKL